MNNRISKYFPYDREHQNDAAWQAKCEQMAEELEHDRAELQAGRMTAEEFDAKW